MAVLSRGLCWEQADETRSHCEDSRPGPCGGRDHAICHRYASQSIRRSSFFIAFQSPLAKPPQKEEEILKTNLLLPASTQVSNSSVSRASLAVSV